MGFDAFRYTWSECQGGRIKRTLLSILAFFFGRSVKPIDMHNYLSKLSQKDSLPFRKSLSLLPVKVFKVNKKIGISANSKAKKASFDEMHPAKAPKTATIDGTNQQQASLHREKYFAEHNVQYRKGEVLVVGAGPAGLVAACELALKGHAVTILEKRSAETWDLRSGMIGLTVGSRAYLAQCLWNLQPSLGDDFVFSHKDKRDITNQKSLKQLLKQLSENSSSNFHYLQTDVMQRILIEVAKKLDVEIKFATEFSLAEPSLQVANCGNSQIGFDHIIHADGSGRASRTLLEQQLFECDPQINVVNTRFKGSSQASYLRCDGIEKMSLCYVHVPEFHKPPIKPENFDQNPLFKKLTQTRLNDYIKQFEQLGWTGSPGIPRFLFHKTSEHSNKVWLSGQAPEGLTKEELLSWNRCILELCAESNSLKGIDFSQLHVAGAEKITNESSERKMKKTVIGENLFDMEKNKLVEPAIKIPFGYSLSVGDANQSANFYYGEGANNAFQQGFEAAVQLTSIR